MKMNWSGTGLWHGHACGGLVVAGSGDNGSGSGRVSMGVRVQ